MANRTREKIESFNNSLKPYYTLIGMILFFITLFVTSYGILIKSPDLSVSIEKENINYPSSINEHYNNVYNYIIGQNPNSELRTSASTVYDYLLRTKQSWTIRLKNETNKTLEKVNMRVINVSQITAWAVSTDFLLEEEKKKVLDKVKYQKNSGVVYLSDFISLPPQSSVSIFLWGKFDESFWNDNTIVTYDGGTGVIEKNIQVAGFKAYLVDYFFEIVFFSILIFSAVYIYKLRGKLSDLTVAETNNSINN